MTTPTPFEEIVKEFREKLCVPAASGDYYSVGKEFGDAIVPYTAATLEAFWLPKLAAVHDSALEKAREELEAFHTVVPPGRSLTPAGLGYRQAIIDSVAALDQLRINQ